MKFARCRCFLDSNVFLPVFGLHVTYKSESQFLSTYGKVLTEMGCQDFKSVTQEIQEELKRRQNIPQESYLRFCHIKANYKPYHPDIFKLKDNFLHDDFKELCKLNQNSSPLALNSLLRHHSENVFSFNVFTADFSSKLLEELEHFQGSEMPQGRPNSMNNYGVLLDELGFNDEFLNPLREKFLQPLCSLLFPADCTGPLDSHKAFSVHYEENKDTDLDFHFDNSEITLNVCLLADCDGGELYFGTPESSTGFGYAHFEGRAVLHRGSVTHAVLPIISGKRVNIVMWLRNSSVRNRKCPMCRREPTLEPVENGWGDGFTILESSS